MVRNTEPQTESPRQRPGPACGWWSLWALAAAAAAVVVPVLTARVGSVDVLGKALQFLGMGTGGPFTTGLYAGGIMSIASFLIALIGLIRRESPRWPAVTGFLLSVIPAFGGICLLCRAPW